MKNFGFNSYKMRVGLQQWKNDIKRVNKANQLLATDKIMVDAIMGTLVNKWTFEEAAIKVKDLQRFNLEWIEEPLNPSNLMEYKKLCKSL